MGKSTNTKLGILGGGQLGKMLALAAGNWDLDLWILDKDKTFPASKFVDHFVEGDFKDYDDVYNFGKKVDVISIEIEHVNTDALIQLKKEGKIVHPDPEALVIIKDKGLQKQFYVDKKLPTSPFHYFESAAEVLEGLKQNEISFPFVQKSREAGYDGKGVAVLNSSDDLKRLLDCPCIVEPKVDIDKELAVIVARNEDGTIAAYPTVEMAFNHEANLVEFLFCPAAISEDLEREAQDLAKKVIAAYDVCGLLAVEFFLDKSGKLLINEVAPRPHNSGHHTIDSAITSQFQQHLRAVLNFPLGKTDSTSPSVMVNLLGHGDYTGTPILDGFDKCLALEGAKFHFYGKKITKPFRKMGHATVVDSDLEQAKQKAIFIRDNLNIIA